MGTVLNVLLAGAPVISSLAAIAAVYYSRKSHAEIQRVEVNINSKMTAFLALTERAARAEGVTAGLAQAASAVPPVP